MRVWVDLVNSPQVLVMRPVIRELERRGHEVVVTSRAFAQTTQLADQAGLRHTPLGRHGGSSRRRAVLYNLERVGLLVRVMRNRGIQVALSHNSYSQALAARLLGVPFVTMMDYEHHRANHIAFRLAQRVLVPEVFPQAALGQFGAAGKSVRYPGLKEDLYLADFHPRPGFLAEHGIPSNRVVVVLRPPATWADYYHGEGRTFAAVRTRLAGASDVLVVYLPRVSTQVDLLHGLPPSAVYVPHAPLDGPNLLAHADLAISGGGTMNREAGVLGTPAYSIFEGRLGAVDARLAEEGRLAVIRHPEDADRIRFEKKGPVRPRPGRPDLAAFVADRVLEVGRGRRRRYVD